MPPSGALPAPIREYLAELDRASHGLPRHERQDLRASVWAEIADVARLDPSPERIVAALERLGPPAQRVGARVAAPRDPVVVHLLGASLLSLGIGGVAGLARLWRSASWPRRDAVAGTILMVAGAVLVPLLTPTHPTAGVLLGGLGVGPLAAALWLGAVLLIARRGRSGHPLR